MHIELEKVGKNKERSGLSESTGNKQSCMVSCTFRFYGLRCYILSSKKEKSVRKGKLGIQ